MKNTAAHVAKFLSLSYVPVSALHMLIHFTRTGDAYMLKFLATQPTFWLTLVGSIYIAIQISQRDVFAWWVGLVGAAILLYFRVSYLTVAVREGFAFLPVGITLLWLLAFVGCLFVIRFGSEKSRSA
jgi:hypothetical protein